MQHTGVVDEDVDVTMLRDHIINHRLDLSHVPDVDLPGQRSARILIDFSGGGLRSLRVVLPR